MEKRYFIGRLEVNEETYTAYRNEKLKWQVFHLGIFWIMCFVFAFLGMWFWIKVLDGENGVRELGYVEACKDSYDGKLKYELVEIGGGLKDWKKKK